MKFHQEVTTQSTYELSKKFILHSTETSKLMNILPHILQSCPEQQYSLLDYNEKLRKHTDLSQNKCRIFSTFHRVSSTPVVKETSKSGVQFNCIYEDLSIIAVEQGVQEKYFNIFKAIKIALEAVLRRLEAISHRVTTTFRKEMDEKYIDATSSYIEVREQDLWNVQALYKEEQEITARRMTSVLACILETSRGTHMYNNFAQLTENSEENCFIELFKKICGLIDNTSCATLYSGLLLSITYFIQNFILNTNKNIKKIIELVITILTSRPMPFVSRYLLGLVQRMIVWDDCKEMLCLGNYNGNLKVDYDQGVFLYKKDSCNLQVLLKQIEICLKFIEVQKLHAQAVETTRHLLILFTNMNCDSISLITDKSRCDCPLILIQTTVYALRICASMLTGNETIDNSLHSIKSEELLSVCRCGIQVLYQCVIRDVEFSSQLSHNEGHLIEFCEIMKNYAHSEVYGNMLSELTGTLQSSPEDMPQSFHMEPWLKSFKSFTLTD